MAIQIKELIIKATIIESDKKYQEDILAKDDSEETEYASDETRFLIKKQRER